MEQRTRYLVVAQGSDAGARLRIGDEVKTVGRARDADLVLGDRAVSRHHFQIVETLQGTLVHVCPGAAPVVHAGHETCEVIVHAGDSFVAGNTVLVVAEPDSPDAPEMPPPASHGVTLLHALMNGPAADARALAAVFALNEALGAAEDIPALEIALTQWGRVHADCESIEALDAPTAANDDATDPLDPEEAPTTGDAAAVLETVADGKARIVVPAHGASPRWLAFATTLPPDRVTDLLRRLLVVAAHIVASRMAQLSVLRAMKEQCESFRRQAVGSAHAFLGTSPAAERLTRMLPRLAASDTVVLLTGETGAGKTFVARLIHESSARKDAPLRVINCASIPDNLIESELFGHERGAFTGAVAARKGALESAGRGTVLLDEIGELPLSSQAKLLRVLEERRFERVGSNRAITLEARVIAATNRDLEAMVAAGTYRSDLFFRISVVSVTVPPLRDRGEDLVSLAQEILADFATSAGRRVDGFTPEALEVIRRYPWPGNVRELRNAIEHALVLGDGPWLSPADLPRNVQSASERTAPRAAGEDPFLMRLPARLASVERQAIEAALLETGGNRTKTAVLLGINRQTLYNKMREYKMHGEPHAD